MRYVLGIDGGQSTTTAVIADETGVLLGAGEGGPANHIHESGGVERIRQSLADAISTARETAGIGDSPIITAYLGMTGGSVEMEGVCRPAVPVERMILGHDSLIALYSVTFGRPGVVVIGGTGSVGFGRNEKGDTATAGGWGYLMGDEGSGYWIALRALSACTKAVDGRGPRTVILPYLLAQFEVDASTPEPTNSESVRALKQIHAALYSGAISRPDIAAISECVGRAAARGDQTSLDILIEAGRELGSLAVSVSRALFWKSDMGPVGYVGGVFRAGNSVLDSFTNTVCQELTDAQIVPAQVPSAVAAALLALESSGIDVDERVIARVNEFLPNLGGLKR